MSNQLFVLRTSCLRAADMAKRIATVAPADSLPVLQATTKVLYRLERGATSSEHEYYLAMFTALDATGQGESQEMVRTLTLFLSGPAGSRNSGIENEIREPLVDKARLLAHTLADELPLDELDALRAALLDLYTNERAEELLEFLNEWLEDEAALRAANSSRLLIPLMRQADTLAGRPDSVALKSAIDRFQAVWAAQDTSPGSGFDANDQRSDFAVSSFYLLRLHAHYAYRQHEGAAIKPVLRDITRRVIEVYGDSSEIARAVEKQRAELEALL
jgi:hypothetical protein